MVNLVYASLWFFALWKWGDWKQWERYYPTILFFILGDFLYLYMLSDLFPMWSYNPPEVDGNIGITNTFVSLSIIIVKYPATVLIYLGKFPTEGWAKKILYYLFWVLIYAINEWTDMKFQLIQYFNGWNYWWSMLFNMVMFFILWVHYQKPIFAWILSIFFIIFLWQKFDVPASVFR